MEHFYLKLYNNANDDAICYSLLFCVQSLYFALSSYRDLRQSCCLPVFLYENKIKYITKYRYFTIDFNSTLLYDI